MLKVIGLLVGLFNATLLIAVVWMIVDSVQIQHELEQVAQALPVGVSPFLIPLPALHFLR